MKETLTREGIEEAMETKMDRSRSVRLTEADLLPGDHICVRRRGRFYTHHGIYMGDGKVIHFAGSIREKIDPVVQEPGQTEYSDGEIINRDSLPPKLFVSQGSNSWIEVIP